MHKHGGGRRWLSGLQAHQIGANNAPVSVPPLISSRFHSPSLIGSASASASRPLAHCASGEAMRTTFVTMCVGRSTHPGRGVQLAQIATHLQVSHPVCIIRCPAPSLLSDADIAPSKLSLAAVPNKFLTAGLKQVQQNEQNEHIGLQRDYFREQMDPNHRQGCKAHVCIAVRITTRGPTPCERTVPLSRTCIIPIIQHKATPTLHAWPMQTHKGMSEDS